MHVVNDHTMCATNKVESSISSKLKSFMGANFYFLLLNLLIVFLFFFPFMVRSQALTGTTGYYNIPTAELYPDRSMFIGTNLLIGNIKSGEDQPMMQWTFLLQTVSYHLPRFQLDLHV